MTDKKFDDYQLSNCHHSFVKSLNDKKKVAWNVGSKELNEFAFSFDIVDTGNGA